MSEEVLRRGWVERKGSKRSEEYRGPRPPLPSFPFRNLEQYTVLVRRKVSESEESTVYLINDTSLI